MKNEPEPPRWFSFSRSVAGYIGYGLGGIVLVTLLFPLSLMLGVFPPLRHGALRAGFRLCCAFLTRAYLPMLGLYRIAEISGYSRARARRPAIYVANHRGRLDGPLLLGIIHNTGVIIKSKYARRPLYSSFVKHLDFVSVNPHSLESLAAAMKACERLLLAGRSLLVFPEGARAASGKMLPFRDFAFRAAANAGVPVVPVVVHSDLPFMAKIKGSHFPRRTFTYRVRFLDAVMRGAGEETAQFTERVRSMLSRELAVLDRGTVWEAFSERGMINGG